METLSLICEVFVKSLKFFFFDCTGLTNAWNNYRSELLWTIGGVLFILFLVDGIPNIISEVAKEKKEKLEKYNCSIKG